MVCSIAIAANSRVVEDVQLGRLRQREFFRGVVVPRLFCCIVAENVDYCARGIPSVPYRS